MTGTPTSKCFINCCPEYEVEYAMYSNISVKRTLRMVNPIARKVDGCYQMGREDDFATMTHQILDSGTAALLCVTWRFPLLDDFKWHYRTVFCILWYTSSSKAQEQLTVQMAFYGRLKSLLRETISPPSGQVPMASMLNTIRCMTSSKLFIGGMYLSVFVIQGLYQIHNCLWNWIDLPAFLQVFLMERMTLLLRVPFEHWSSCGQWVHICREWICRLWECNAC